MLRSMTLCFPCCLQHTTSDCCSMTGRRPCSQSTDLQEHSTSLLPFCHASSYVHLLGHPPASHSFFKTENLPVLCSQITFWRKDLLLQKQAHLPKLPRLQWVYLSFSCALTLGSFWDAVVAPMFFFFFLFWDYLCYKLRFYQILCWTALLSF